MKTAPRVQKNVVPGGRVMYEGIGESDKLIVRETESILQAQFFANLMVQTCYQMPDGVCWINRETYANDEPGHGHEYDKRHITVLGTFLHNQARNEVEVLLTLEHKNYMQPRGSQWPLSSWVCLFKVDRARPRVQWDMMIEHFRQDQ